MKRWMSIFCLLTLFMQAGFAQGASEPVQAEILVEHQAVQPGAPVYALIKLDLAKDWHAYWKNPGQSGFPTEVQWELPAGWSVGTTKWPTPERIVIQDLVNYGYHDELYLITELIPPKTLSEKSVTLKAEVKWLVCSEDTCLPGSKEFTLTLPVAAAAEKHAASAPSFQKARAKLPAKWGAVRAERQKDEVVLTLEGLQGETAHFYPETAELVHEATSGSGKDRFNLTLAETDLKDCVIKGIAVVNEGGVQKSFEVEVPLEADLCTTQVAMADIAVERTHDAANFDGGFLMALLFAFAGGLILNLMPCVLPVISLKIFSFVKMSGEKRSEIVRHGVLFTLGVLVSFWALAGALIALQASGAAVGWGFQLQDPLFVGILTAIIFVFGLSLFGVFEFGTTFSSWAGQQQSNIGQSSSGKASAFFSGVLATTVATPCTGPFLGPAIGFAMTLSALGSLTVFTFLALGMASPYLLISLFPSLIRFLPKPGKWMVTFKEILGFCMVATALWLVWVFAAQTSMMATSALLIALFGLSVGSWIYGKWGTPLRKRPVRIVAYALTLATLLGSTGLVVRASQMIEEPVELVAVNDPTAESKDIHGWEPFNKERLDYLRSQGIPVFIDFTARWCLICQANHMVLSTEEVEERMAEAGVVKMLADWTKNDPEITAELKKFGRSGVPLYLLYCKEEEPTILPQMLSPDLVVEYIDTTL